MNVLQLFWIYIMTNIVLFVVTSIASILFKVFSKDKKALKEWANEPTTALGFVRSCLVITFGFLPACLFLMIMLWNNYLIFNKEKRLGKNV